MRSLSSFFRRKSSNREYITLAGKSTTQVFALNPKLSDYTYMYQRDEIFNRIVNKLSTDVFNFNLNIVSTKATLVKAAENLFNTFDIMPKFMEAYKTALIYGYSVIHIIEKSKKLSGIVVYSPLDVQQIEVNNDKGSEDYGKIVSYKLSTNFFEGVANLKKDVIKDKETIHICPDMINGDPRGVSLSQKLYDKIQEKKNIDYSLAQALYKNATPLRMLITPPDISEEDFSDAALKFKDINMKTEFVAPQGFDIKSIDTGDLPNPEPFVNYYLQTIAAGSSVPYALLISNQSGLANTRVALQQYMDDLEAIRYNFIKPKLIEFITKLQNDKILPTGSFDLIIERKQSIDAIDQSTMMYNLSRAVSQLVELGVIDINEARDILGFPEAEIEKSPEEKQDEKNEWRSVM